MNKRHEAWLAKAESDLKFAELGLQGGFFDQVCFLSQQAIEKSFKAALIALGQPYPKSHHLIELADLLPQLKLGPWHDRLAIIDRYYLPARYPDTAPAIKESGLLNEDEAKEALSTAQEIFKKILDFL